MQPKAARNIVSEALRYIAVAGLAVFHTFQWTFQATCVGVVEYAPLAVAILLGILMSLCLALALLLVDIVRRTVVESIKPRMNG